MSRAKDIVEKLTEETPLYLEISKTGDDKYRLILAKGNKVLNVAEYKFDNYIDPTEELLADLPNDQVPERVEARQGEKFKTFSSDTLSIAELVELAMDWVDSEYEGEADEAAKYKTTMTVSGLSDEGKEKLTALLRKDPAHPSVDMRDAGTLEISTPYDTDVTGNKSDQILARWKDTVNKSGVAKSGITSTNKQYVKEESERKWVGAVKEANGRVHYANSEGKPATKPFLFDTKMKAEKMAQKLKKDHPLWVEVIVAPQDTDLGGVSKKVSGHKFTK